MDEPMLTQPPPKQSRKLLKWMLLGCGGSILLVAVLLGISGYFFVVRNMSTDAAKAESVAHEILPFEKPPGYTWQMSMVMFGMKSAMLVSHPDGGGAGGGIVLISMPKGAQEEFRKQMRSNLQKQGYGKAVSEQLPGETFRIRGRDTPAQVAILSPKDSSWNALQYTIELDGSSGDLVTLSITGSEQQTSHDWVQKFLDSVK
jgi:hypothetical protein